MPKLIPFKAEHLMAFVNRDTWTQSDWRGVLEKERNPSFTAVADDLFQTVIGCAGVIIIWPGVGIAWMNLSKEIESHGIWMTRTVKHILRDITRSFNLHRIEAVVLADNERNTKWIRLLGFTRENGTARKYTQDKMDSVRYELVED